ncbi:restriction endonuclease subunit S [Chryseobacterium sp. R2ACT005]|uniref:restriction endonuclease subunit S n=1 Tax=Chryseobacterium sp. R2ACT005 TaxID=3416668 RepID=UPI003CF49417
MADKELKVSKVPNLRFSQFTGEWEVKKLGEIATFSKGKGISKSDIDESGITKCIRYGELYTHYREIINDVKSKTNVDISTLILSEENDVIIPASGETSIDIATASCVLKSGIALGGDLNIIKTKNNGIFLSYYLNSKKKIEIANLAQGISVVHLYSSQLASLSLSLPKLNEQNRISSFLALLDERIQTQNKILKELDVLKKSISYRIFSQKSKFTAFEGHESQKWQPTKLQQVCEIFGGGTPDTNRQEYWKGDIQWFTPTEIKRNFVSKSERTITALGLKNSSAKLLPKGTILLTTRATIGETSIAIVECATNQGFQSLVTKENCYNIFLFYWLKNNKQELKKRANGSTFAEISKAALEKIEIKLPSLEEQIKIASFLLSIDTKIDIESQYLEKLEQEKQFLLKQMFV